MASEGPGKYRERKTRTNKPYERPKGIIRRVTDSVTGLFSSSWLSGWLGAEDEEEGSDQQPRMAAPQNATVHPPGESFIFARPVTGRKSFRPIYPEEGDTESNSQQPLGVNEGASTSSGIRVGLPAASPAGILTPAGRLAESETPSPMLPGRKLPILSSTPASMFTARTKSHLEPRPLQLLTSSTPTGDDGSEVSESSVDTGVDASVIPRPDERDYQQEILQLDEESLQTLRDTLTKSAPAPPAPQPPACLPSLDETRKRPRDMEPDHTSIRAEGSTSSRSLFSDAGEPIIGTPQPSGLANKRPRFNISTYGSPVVGDRSVLSNSTFKSSPFYPGKTMYGGASAYRRHRLQSRTSHQTTRLQVKTKPAETADDGGLSQAARRILDSLEQMSTPLTDAKRIPTPTPGQRGSFLDAAPSYTASFYKHRPNLRSAPPTSKLLTPTKLPVQENLSTFLQLPPSTSNMSSGSPKRSSKPEETKKMKGSPVVGMLNTESNPPPFSKVTTEASTKFKSTPITSTPAPQFSSSLFRFSSVASNNSASEQTQDLAAKPGPIVSDTPPTLKEGGGKIKAKVVESGRASSRQDEAISVEDPKLPAVPLTISSLPTINLSLTVPAAASPASSGSGVTGFRFSIPEVVDTQAPASETVSNALTFTFSNPALINEDDKTGGNSVTTSGIHSVMFNSSSPSFAPKLKAGAKKEVPKANKLQTGSILDILKPKGSTPEKLGSVSSTASLIDTKIGSKIGEFCSPKVSSESIKPVVDVTFNNVDKTSVSQGFEGFGLAFKKSSDEWECSVCMVRNKNSADKCVACETAKPEKGGSKNIAASLSNADPAPAITGNGTDWGAAFKKSSNEWDCDVCMVRNKDSVDKCVACETPRPGSKAKPAQVADSKPLDNKEEKVNFGFGSAFAKAKGEWECDTCLVRNKSDATKCISCETPKPGAANVSQAITGNFKFGVNTTDSSTSSSSNFKFGVDKSQTEVKSSSGFSFGVSAKIGEDSNSKGDSGFKFGLPVAVTSSTTDSSSESDKSKENTSASSSFSFGIKPSESRDKEVPSASLNFTFSSHKTPTSNTETVNTNPTFSFGSGTQSLAPFTFGAGTEAKTKQSSGDQLKTLTEVKPASEIKSGSVVDALKDGVTAPSKALFTFGASNDKVDGSIAKPAFAFNDAVVTSSKAGDTGPTESALPSSMFSFGAKGKESSSGATTTVATAAPLFTFGDKGSNTSSAPSFSFNTTPVNKEETKATPTFSFGGKRENSDSSEPPKKAVFGGSAPSINNGVGSPSSLFTFGRKENELAPGPGFSTPTTTPAFGAPTPASNATPSFQFGNSNPPAPAATAPPAFGNPAPAFGSSAPAFGSNNNNSTPSFTFGQPPEKKSGTGFDFGQAPANNPAQGFNFGAAAASPGIFQFGQSPANSTPSSGLFQFGAGSTPVQQTTGLGENPFSAPANPSGRVVKKAVRRTRKQQ